MSVMISSVLLDQMLRHAAETPDREVCGLLFGGGDRVDAATACTNVAADRERNFEIDPSALIAAHRAARAGAPVVVGHYHSHPTGVPVPSPRDAAQAMGDGAIWMILGGGRVRAWRTLAAGLFVEEEIIPSGPSLPRATDRG